MIKNMKLWIARHYVSTLLTFFFAVTAAIMLMIVVMEMYFPTLRVDYLNTCAQFLAALLGGLCSSIVVIYASNLQNKVQKKFISKQEENERERMLLTFYIDKIKEFEQKHKTFITLSNEFIQNSSRMRKQEIKTYFNQIRDELVLIHRFKYIFKHVELTEEWQTLSIYVTSLHDFFVTEAAKIDKEQQNPNLNLDFKDQHYFKITRLISEMSNKLLEYQSDKILNLIP
ncbi:hypothetical protein NHG23_02175 [Aerococcaceae bacterium NML190073]|nr:hypothetical protein [Aerococcaceae bacterium NML190073]